MVVVKWMQIWNNQNMKEKLVCPGVLVANHYLEWKGISRKLQFFRSTSLPNKSTVTQCQAMALSSKESAVLYKHVDGYYGLPGGHIEKGESVVDCLTREIYEETGCLLIDSILVGYVLDTNLETGSQEVQPRYIASVALLDEYEGDPDKKALSRIIAEIPNVPDLLGWGDFGIVLVNELWSSSSRLRWN